VIRCFHISGLLHIKPRDSQLEVKSALSVRNARRHAQGITAIYSPLKSMILYWILGMIVDELKSLQALQSIIRMKWKSIGSIGFHGRIAITRLCILEKSPMSCHLMAHLTNRLIPKHLKNPLGDPSTLSHKTSYQYCRSTLMKCLIRKGFVQASLLQECRLSWFQNHMSEAYDCV
jgi:hypothetical protein